MTSKSQTNGELETWVLNPKQELNKKNSKENKTKTKTLKQQREEIEKQESTKEG